jgi:hypothetical protein
MRYYSTASTLGIDRLMDPEDFVDLGGERFSTMTYLSGCVLISILYKI